MPISDTSNSRGRDFWFGGGIDLTPCYVHEEDIAQFHRTLRETCDLHGKDLYPRYKKWCDDYFTIRHRGETRGVGGIFFDYVRGDGEALFAFVRSAAGAFLPAYTPIVLRRKGEPWGERERQWQLFRRGRYVEFNLVYDRGTTFGLETGGRAESILMSLPPLVRWGYDIRPEPGSPEAKAHRTAGRPEGLGMTGRAHTTREHDDERGVSAREHGAFLAAVAKETGSHYSALVRFDGHPTASSSNGRQDAANCGSTRRYRSSSAPPGATAAGATIVRQPAKGSAAGKPLAAAGMHAIAVLPLKVRRTTVGALCLGSRRPFAMHADLMRSSRFSSRRQPPC